MTGDRRVTLRFHPDLKASVVNEIMHSYAVEANAKIDFPTPDTATLVLPSECVAMELLQEAMRSPMHIGVLFTANV